MITGKAVKMNFSRFQPTANATFFPVMTLFLTFFDYFFRDFSLFLFFCLGESTNKRPPFQLLQMSYQMLQMVEEKESSYWKKCAFCCLLSKIKQGKRIHATICLHMFLSPVLCINIRINVFTSFNSTANHIILNLNDTFSGSYEYIAHPLGNWCNL